MSAEVKRLYQLGGRMNVIAWGIFALLLGVMIKGDTMYLSADGFAALQAREGFRAEQYLDSAGFPTIGYGHLVKAGEVFDGPLTQAHALNLLREDIADAAAIIDVFVVVPLTQNQYDALLSFVFNVGGQAFKTSTLLVKLNKGDYQGAAEEFTRWKYAGGKVLRGLEARRADEKKQFLT